MTEEELKNYDKMELVSLYLSNQKLHRAIPFDSDFDIIKAIARNRAAKRRLEFNSKKLRINSIKFGKKRFCLIEALYKHDGMHMPSGKLKQKIEELLKEMDQFDMSNPVLKKLVLDTNKQLKAYSFPYRIGWLKGKQDEKHHFVCGGGWRLIPKLARSISDQESYLSFLKANS